MNFIYRFGQWREFSFEINVRLTKQDDIEPGHVEKGVEGLGKNFVQS